VGGGVLKFGAGGLFGAAKAVKPNKINNNVEKNLFAMVFIITLKINGFKKKLLSKINLNSIVIKKFL
jgi:hypothetical protein